MAVQTLLQDLALRGPVKRIERIGGRKKIFASWQTWAMFSATFAALTANGTVRPTPRRSIGGITTKRRERIHSRPDLRTTVFGIDIGKNVFHVAALNADGAVIQRAKFSRDTLMAFFEAAPKVLVGMEASPGLQWLARRLAAMGHDARIIPARFVRPYVKSNKTDTVDGE